MEHKKLAFSEPYANLSFLFCLQDLQGGYYYKSSGFGSTVNSGNKRVKRKRPIPVHIRDAIQCCDEIHVKDVILHSSSVAQYVKKVEG